MRYGLFGREGVPFLGRKRCNKPLLQAYLGCESNAARERTGFYDFGTKEESHDGRELFHFQLSALFILERGGDFDGGGGLRASPE